MRKAPSKVCFPQPKNDYTPAELRRLHVRVLMRDGRWLVPKRERPERPQAKLGTVEDEPQKHVRPKPKRRYVR